MPKLIFDEFSQLPVSAQRRYQLRKEKAQCCRICGGPGTPYCAEHKKAQKGYYKGRLGFIMQVKRVANGADEVL